MLTHARLKELLKYNRRTGVFTWRIRSGHAMPDTVAGGVNSDGYVQIKIGRVLHKAHRLAWLYVRGEWPDDQIDHRNGVRSDNRFRNLRQADGSQNSCNRAIRSDNTSGITGVNWSKELRKWRVRVMKNGQRRLIGDFSNVDDAIAARVAAALNEHGVFAGELRI